MSSEPEATLRSLAPWDVIFPFDDRAHPSKHKMWVCVSRTRLWFLRINSQAYDGSCVPLPHGKHPFLSRDSFLGCGGDLIGVAEAELLDLLAQQAMPDRQGVIGHIAQQLRAAVCSALFASRLLSPAQVRIIQAELGCSAH